MIRYLNFTDFDRLQAQAENILAWFRRRFGFPNSPPVPVEMIAQALFGLRCESRRLGRLGERTVGALSVDDRVIHVDERCNRHQYIFAVAHEIGHWVLHEGNHCSHVHFDNGQSIPLSHILGSTRVRTNKQKARLRDIEANRFAAALLIPRSFLFSETEKYEIIGAEAIGELARAFHVSEKAMLYRIQNVSKYLAWSGPRIDWDSLHRIESLLAERRLTAKQMMHGSADQQGQRFRSIGEREVTVKVVGDYLRRQIQGQVIKGGRAKPMIIEFAGTSNAGKDTQINIIKDYLDDVYDYGVRIIDEAVKSCRAGRGLDIDTIYRSAALTVTRLYEARLENPGSYDFVIFNRGLFDTLAFVTAARMYGLISEQQEQIHVNYLLSYAHLQDIVFLFLISPEEALRRERESKRNFVNKLAERDGESVPDQGILNSEMLTLLNTSYMYTYNHYKGLFKRIYPLGIPNGDQQGIVERALGLIEVILPNSAQMPIPDLFDVCYVHRNSSNKAQPASRQSLPKSCRQSQVQYRRCVQLSFLETIGVV